MMSSIRNRKMAAFCGISLFLLAMPCCKHPFKRTPIDEGSFVREEVPSLVPHLTDLQHTFQSDASVGGNYAILRISGDPSTIRAALEKRYPNLASEKKLVDGKYLDDRLKSLPKTTLSESDDLRQNVSYLLVTETKGEKMSELFVSATFDRFYLLSFWR